MNFLFRLFVFLGSVVVVALFSALIAPYFINWDKFTNEFEAQASRVAGQEVRVGGKTSLRILPLPFLSFEDLQVGRNADGSPLMTVERFSLNAELLPFLSGEVRIVDMTMLRPALNLQVAEDGTVPWTSPTEQIINPELVNIENLEIQNGSVLVTGLTGDKSLRLENIQGDFQANSMIGPWRINATADVDGIASEIKASTGTMQEDGSMRLKLDLNRPDEPYQLTLDGPVRLENEALSWVGNFRVLPFPPSRVAEMDDPREPLPVFSTGVFSATPKQVDVSEYRLEVGSREDPYVITGQGKISLENEINFAMQADGRQIDVDALQSDADAGPGSGSVERATLDARFAALIDVLKRVPVPSAKGNIDVVLPAIVVGDTFIRDVMLNVSPTGAGWVVRDLGATLPGNTRLEANGRLGLKNGFGFSGKVLLASRQPSGFADWISGNVDDTFRQLRSLGFASDVTVSPRQANFENIELRLDDALMRGKLRRLYTGDTRPAIIAELKGNRVNIKDLAAIYSLTRNSDDDEPHDLDFKVNADLFEAEFRGRPITARELDVHATIRQGTVSVKRLNAARLFGAKIETTGSIENILDSPNGNMKLELEADNAVELLEFAQKLLGENLLISRLMANSDLTRNTQLSLELDTTGVEEGARGRLLANGVVGGSDVSLQIGFDGDLRDLTKMPLTIEAGFGNPSLLVLMQQMGIQTLPDPLTGGLDIPAKLDLGLSGIAEKGFETRGFLTAETINLAASGMVSTLDWNRFDTDLDVTLGSLDIGPYVHAAAIPVPFFISERAVPFSAAFKMSKNGRDFAFDNIKGQVANNSFNGDLKLKQEQVLRPRLSGSLSLSEFALPHVAESVFGRVTNIGRSLGLTEEISLGDESIFGEPMYPGIDANLQLAATRLLAGEWLTGTNAKARLVMTDGALALNDLSFSLMGGTVTGGFGLKNTAGTVIANLNYSAVGVQGGQFSDYIGLPSIFEGRFDANGQMEATGQSVASLVGNLSGTGFVSIDRPRISGMNPTVFDTILAATASEDYEISSGNVERLVSDVLFEKGFDASGIEAPFSISRGKLRARNISYALSDSALVSDLEYDMNANSLSASTVISFQPSRRDAISGADPQVVVMWQGAPFALERSIDTDRLEGYLSLRSFENSQRRLESLEAQVIETQRLRNRIAYTFARERYEERKRQEAIRAEEERKLREAEEAAAEAERQRLIEEERQREEAERQARIEAEAAKAREAPQQENQPSEPPAESIFENIEDFLTTN